AGGRAADPLHRPCDRRADPDRGRAAVSDHPCAAANRRAGAVVVARHLRRPRCTGRASAGARNRRAGLLQRRRPASARPLGHRQPDRPARLPLPVLDPDPDPVLGERPRLLRPAHHGRAGGTHLRARPGRPKGALHVSEATIPSRVRLPADVELEDKLAFGLTARQLLLLAATVVPVYGLYTVAASVLPTAVAAALCAPLAIVGAVLALGRRDGLPADRLARLALRYLTAPRQRLLAPEGLPAPLPGGSHRRPALPLDLPVRTVFRSGLVELSDRSFCVLLRAASGSFTLKSDEEQAALVEAFGRFLN